MDAQRRRALSFRLRRKAGVALLTLAFTLHAAPLLAQGTPGTLYLGIDFSRAPLNSATAGSSVQLTADADLSPFPSYIDYPSESASTTWMAGLTAGYRPYRSAGVSWRAHLETSYVYSALTDRGPSLDISTLELGVGYFLPMGSTAGLEIGLAAMGGLATGQVGTVGSRQGDIFLISPDDMERYETNSEIWTTGYGFGADATLTALVGPVSVTAGYRLATPIESWSYRVRDADDSGRSSKLPAEGFRANPPAYDLDGVFFRMGIAIPLRLPSRASAPRPAPPPPPQVTVPATSERDVQPDPPEEVKPAETVPPVVYPEPPPPPGPERIRWVQERLNSQGYDCGPEDGAIGPRTRACIRAFQQQWDLPATGDLDDATLDMIRTL